MTLALAGIFRECIVLGADTLTTRIVEENSNQYELSHKIEEYRGIFAFIFSGLKYIPDLDIESGTSINLLLRTLEKEISTVDPELVFTTLSENLNERFNTCFGLNKILIPFQLVMAGYNGRKPFYWFYDYDDKRRPEINKSETIILPYAIIRCGGKNARGIVFYESAGRDTDYAHLDTKEGLKLIRRLLAEAYDRELASGYPPAINNVFEFAVLSPTGFYWHTRHRLNECLSASEAVKRLNGLTE